MKTFQDLLEEFIREKRAISEPWGINSVGIQSLWEFSSWLNTHADKESARPELSHGGILVEAVFDKGKLRNLYPISTSQQPAKQGSNLTVLQVNHGVVTCPKCFTAWVVEFPKTER